MVTIESNDYEIMKLSLEFIFVIKALAIQLIIFMASKYATIRINYK
jgi:hypothetical protein